MSLHVTVAATPPRRTIPAHDLQDKLMPWAWLRFARATGEAKVDDLDDDTARRRLVASPTTLAGVLTHTHDRRTALVRQSRRRRQPADALRHGPSRRDWDTAGVNGAEIFASYRRACADSDEVITRLAMDSIGAQTHGDYTLRWTMIHVFGDTIRQAGQADILREPTDGRRGW